MSTAAPEWATPPEIEQHGRLFLHLFADRKHFEHYLATGSLATRKTDADTSRHASDPIVGQRYALSKRVSQLRRDIRLAEKRIAEAHGKLAECEVSSWEAINRHRHEEALKRAEASLVQHQENLRRAEVDAELFRVAHPPRTSTSQEAT